MENCIDSICKYRSEWFEWLGMESPSSTWHADIAAIPWVDLPLHLTCGRIDSCGISRGVFFGYVQNQSINHPSSLPLLELRSTPMSDLCMGPVYLKPTMALDPRRRNQVGVVWRSDGAIQRLTAAEVPKAGTQLPIGQGDLVPLSGPQPGPLVKLFDFMLPLKT